MSWMIVGLIEWGMQPSPAQKIERDVYSANSYYFMICVIVSVMGGGDWGK